MKSLEEMCVVILASLSIPIDCLPHFLKERIYISHIYSNSIFLSKAEQFSDLTKKIAVIKRCNPREIINLPIYILTASSFTHMLAVERCHPNLIFRLPITLLNRRAIERAASWTLYQFPQPLIAANFVLVLSKCSPSDLGNIARIFQNPSAEIAKEIIKKCPKSWINTLPDNILYFSSSN